MVHRPRTQPLSPTTRKRRVDIQRIGTVNNVWQDLLSKLTAWYDAREVN